MTNQPQPQSKVRVIDEAYKDRVTTNAIYMRRLRAERYAAGLNWNGEERKNRRHPELKGLTLRQYRKLYMRKLRQEKANDKVSYHADNAGGAHKKDTNDK